MALSITVNGAGTFTASMEEGPVSFTASLASVGPAGPAGATGPAGVVAASAPITYNAGTQTVGISDTPTFTSVGFSSPGSAVTINAEYYIPFSATYDTAGMEYRGDKVVFPDNTEQVTAFVGEARKVYITARNNTGSTIAKGKVVYLSGATGNKPTMALAQADAEATSARTIGILVEQTANNADGKVIISGAAENIDTSAFSDGDTLYLSASTAGGMTTTLPTQPLHGVVIGIVTRANPSVGSIEVAINNYQELEELSDVLISGEANNDLLAWDSTASVWKNRTFSALGLLTSATAASTYQTIAGMSAYAPLASPTFTGTVTIPAGASISGYLTTSTAASTYAPLDSPALTGTPTAPTAAASTNTTQIATTAFVQQEVPAASTTAAGKVELATDAEAVAGTSTTTVVTPANLAWQSLDEEYYYGLENSTWGANTSGTGAASSQTYTINKQVAAPTSVAGYASLITGLRSHRAGENNQTAINFSKPIWMSGKLSRSVIATPDVASICRLTLGKNQLSPVTFTDPTDRAIGWSYSNDKLDLLVHNGTTLTRVASTHTMAWGTVIDWMIYSDGSGNVTLYVNGSQVATTSAGPSTKSSSTLLCGLQFEAENTTTLTAGRNVCDVSCIKVRFAR